MERWAKEPSFGNLGKLFILNLILCLEKRKNGCVTQAEVEDYQVADSKKGLWYSRCFPKTGDDSKYNVDKTDGSKETRRLKCPSWYLW